MNNPRRETLVGGFVVVLGALFMAYASGGRAPSRNDDDSGYLVTARFNRTDGLGAGGAVRLGGIPVGTIIGQTLTDDFRAIVTMKVHAGVALPVDSAALIQSDGLLGSKYIELQPGGSEKMLAPDGRLTYTQGSIIVDDLLARILSQAKAKRAKATAKGVEGGDHEKKPD